MLLVMAVDAAGMPSAADLENPVHHFESVFKVSLVAEEGKQRRQFFSGELELLADAVPDHHDKLPVLGISNPRRQSFWGNGHGVHDPVPLSSHMAFFSISRCSSVAR
jgi:hypothetical protein